MSGYKPSIPPFYLSASSANALISDLQPTSISPPALLHVNLFLDEILYTFLSSAESLNPSAIRSAGVPAVFSAEKGSESTGIRSLGRSAVGEAELELRSWVESNGRGNEGFGRDGKGTGMRRGGFALSEAFEVMRGKCEEFSTLASQEDTRASKEENRMDAWINAGGSGEDSVISPAALYITAILEHVCEHVLSALARVVGRDSGNTSASLEDLFTAVAEDESIWGFFKRMHVRVSLEEAIKSRQKRSGVSRPSADSRAGRASPGHAGSQTSLVHSNSSPGRDYDSSTVPTKKSSLPPSSYDPRQSHDSPRSGNGFSASLRKSPSLPSTGGRFTAAGISREHSRTPSVISAQTRSMIGAYNDQVDGSIRSKRDEQDEFDALMASGETMKVSLTPSRLKTFDNGRKSQPGSPSRSTFGRDGRVPGSSPIRADDLPPLLPRGTPARNSNDTPPRPPRASSLQTRSGSASVTPQPKLQARGGSIITEQDTEELDDELDSPFKLKAKKESLAELLAASGPAQHPDAEEGRKRSVPAVILGSAPPSFKETQPSSRSIASVNRPDRTPDVDTLSTGAPKKRTPAQEMADFFNDGPPVPPSTTRRPSAPASIGKSRTETQEMADFFASTSPPLQSGSASSSKYGSPIENIAPAKKGFKGFMSKIGGGGRSKDRKASMDQGAGLDEIPTAGGPSWSGAKGYQAQNLEGKRQKSMASMATSPSQAGSAGVGLGINQGMGGTSARSIAEAYRQQQSDKEIGTMPPPPPPAKIQKSTPIPTTTLESSGVSPSPSPSIGGPGRAGVAVAAGAAGAATAGAIGLVRKTSVRKPVPYSTSDVPAASPDMPTSPAITAPSESPVMSPGRRKPSTVDEDAGIVPDQPPVSLEAPIDTDGPRPQTLKGEKSKDDLSFSTAREEPGSATSSGTKHEGDDTDTPKVESAGLVGGIDSVPEADVAREGMANGDHDYSAEDAKIDSVPETSAIRDSINPSDTASQPSQPTHSVSTNSIPSIPLSDLLPLRQLLNHCTSTKECQLLLNAVLSQWGVPPSTEEGEKVDVDSKVAAWLLAGKEGPDTRGAPVRRRASAQEEIKTPASRSKHEEEGEKEEGGAEGGIIQKIQAGIGAVLGV